MNFHFKELEIREADPEDILASYVVTCPEHPGVPVEGGIVHVGWDVEYEQLDDTTNDIVSTQLWILEAGLGVMIHWRKGAGRLTLLDVVRLAYRVASKRLRMIDHLRIVSHFSRAEFASTRWKWHSHDMFVKIISIDDCFVSAGVDEIGFSDASRNWKDVMVSFHDSWLLSGHAALNDLGKALDMPKIELPLGAIRSIRSFSCEDSELFFRYGLLDAIITVQWFCWFDVFRRDLVPTSKMPLTASHLAGMYLLDRCGEHTLLGHDDDRQEVDPSDVKILEMTYHGGRNECYEVGLIDQFVTDADLVSAYPSTLLLLDDPAWDERINFDSPQELPGPFVIGAALIDYEFDQACKFPGFAHHTDFGLVFPREGQKVWVTIPELWTCWQSGYLKKLHLHRGRSFFFFPTRRSRIRESTIELIKRRQDLADKNSAEGLLLKLIANSCYGKLAQGIDKKRSSLDLREALALQVRVSRRLPEGSLYSPGLAAYITGVVRSMIFEMTNKLDVSGHLVISATTDGILFTGALDECFARGIGLPLSSLMHDGRCTTLDSQSPLLEVKHTAESAVSLKNRLSWGLPSATHLGRLHIQRGGLQTNDDHGDKVTLGEAIKQLTERYLRWNWSGAKYSLNSVATMFASPKPRRKHHEDKIRTGELKLVSSTRVTAPVVTDLIRSPSFLTINADYDLKRRPDRSTLKDTTVSAFEMAVDRPRFSTVPWTNVTEAERARHDYAAYAGTHGRNIMKDAASVLDFIDYFEIRDVADGQVRNRERIISGKLARALLNEAVSPPEVIRITGLPSSSVYKMRKRNGIEKAQPINIASRSKLKSTVEKVDAGHPVKPLDPSKHGELITLLDGLLLRIESSELRSRIRSKLVRDSKG